MNESQLKTNAISVNDLGQREIHYDEMGLSLSYMIDYYNYENIAPMVITIICRPPLPELIMDKVESGFATLEYQDPLTLEMIYLPVVAAKQDGGGIVRIWVENA